MKKKIKARIVSCKSGRNAYDMRVVLKGRSDCGTRIAHKGYTRGKNPGWPVLNVSCDSLLADRFRAACVKNGAFASHALAEAIASLASLSKPTLRRKVANVRLKGKRRQFGVRLNPSLVTKLRRAAKRHGVTVTGIMNAALTA